MKVIDLITRLQERYNKDDEIACDIWTEYDVVVVAEQNGMKLTEAQVHQVLRNMNEKKDAEVGLNWDVVYWTIHAVKEGEVK